MVVGPHVSASAYAELAAIKLAETDVSGVTARVAGLASRVVPGAGEVSVLLVGARGPSTAASTGPLALELDDWQCRRGLGPALEAIGERVTVSAADLTTEIRWTEWTARAVAAGARSFLSIVLPVGDDVIGALTVYGWEAAAFGGDTVRNAQVFARAAAVSVANVLLYDSVASTAEHLRSAMASRSVIEQAKGVIMSGRRCTADEALDVLVKAARGADQPLRDVAAALVERTQNDRRP